MNQTKTIKIINFPNPEQQAQQQAQQLDVQLRLSFNASTPLLSKQLFADLVGVSVRVVDGWITKGYLPVIKMGRYSLINIAKVQQQCLEDL